MKKKRVPPDPEKMNRERAEWAEIAIQAFMDKTGTDREDALCDLLADLGHWCDREGFDFDHEQARAADHYYAETNGKGQQLHGEPEPTEVEAKRDPWQMTGRELKDLGYAVIIWTPEELRGADPTHVEDRSVELGWDVIDCFATEAKPTCGHTGLKDGGRTEVICGQDADPENVCANCGAARCEDHSDNLSFEEHDGRVLCEDCAPKEGEK